MSRLCFTLLAIAGLAGNFACNLAFGSGDIVCTMFVVIGIGGLVAGVIWNAE